MDLEQLAVDNLRKYVRIPSISNRTDYADCVHFLKEQAESISLECTVVHIQPTKPVVIMKWAGSKPNLASILLNSHMDVVPVEEDKWLYPPFAAHLDEEDRIFGRGTQDMKSIGIQYLEAIRRLKAQRVQLARNVVVTFVPDEETGGTDGMYAFVDREEFRELNVGLCLDESATCPKPGTFYLYFAEKHKWSVRFHVVGDAGHGSMNIVNTAGEKLARLLRTLYEYRDEQIRIAEGELCCSQAAGLNVTIIQGGTQENVIPAEFTVTVDMRLPPNVDICEWKTQLDDWCTHAGIGVWYEEVHCQIVDKPTPIDATNPYYQAIVEGVTEMGIEIEPVVSTGITDARFLRNKGIFAFGLTPISGDVLLHCHNEYIYRKDFLRGIDIYGKLLEKLGNVNI